MSGEISVLFASEMDKNPYHELLIKSLREQGVNIRSMDMALFLPFTRSVYNNDIDVVHLGTLYRYFTVYSYTPSSIINTALTVVRAIWLCLDLLLVQLLGGKIAWTVHNKYHHERHYHKIEKILSVIVGNIVNIITVKCESARKSVCDLYMIRDVDKVRVVPDGNYINIYQNNITRSDARGDLDISQSATVILYFGLIRPYKGVHELIDIFNSIDSDSQLLVVGKPNNKETEQKLRSAAEMNDQIHLELDYIPRESVQVYMNAADALVLPYREVLNSGSAHLGMTFGLPIIAPRLGCLPEIVSSENRLLYDPTSKMALKTELQSIEGYDLSFIGKANYDRAKSRDWEKPARSYKSIYESITGKEERSYEASHKG